MTPRAQAIKEIKGFGRDILTLSDDSFVSRLATSYNGIGLDEEAIIIRERIHQSTSLSELLSSLDSRILNNIPILRDVLREIINSEKQFSENSDARARAGHIQGGSRCCIRCWKIGHNMFIAGAG